MSKTDRKEVYAVIDRERDYQDSLWPHDGLPSSIGEAVLMLEEYASLARKSWTNETAPEVGTLDIIRKIAAIGVRCMEDHGAPERLI